MTNRVKLLLFAGGAVIIIAGAAYGISTFMSRSTPTPVVSTPATVVDNTTTPTTTPAVTNQNAITSAAAVEAKKPAPALKSSESMLISIALPFVERMGSYSNQGGSGNLEMLLPFMTSSMKQWAQGRIDAAKTAGYQPIYSGTSTSVLSYHVTAVNTNDAQLQMTTQRKESVGAATNSKIYNQDVDVRMLKEAGVWLVDSVDWK